MGLRILAFRGNWYEAGTQTPLQIKQTPHSARTVWWLLSHSRTMCAATSRKRFRSSLKEQNKELKVSTCTQIQVWFSYMGLKKNCSPWSAVSVTGLLFWKLSSVHMNTRLQDAFLKNQCAVVMINVIHFIGQRFYWLWKMYLMCQSKADFHANLFALWRKSAPLYY